MTLFIGFFGIYNKELLSAFHRSSSGDPDWMFAPVYIEHSHRKPMYLFDILIPFNTIQWRLKVKLSSMSQSIMAKTPQPEKPILAVTKQFS